MHYEHLQKSHIGFYSSDNLLSAKDGKVVVLVDHWPSEQLKEMGRYHKQY
jgi:hypothetical protein